MPSRADWALDEKSHGGVQAFFKFGFVELFEMVCMWLPKRVALSPLRGALPEGEPWNGGKTLIGKRVLLG